jgi:hypothetical protein
MKRVILVLTLAFFIVGMAATSVTFAGNSNKTAAFDKRAQEMGQTHRGSGLARASVAHDMKRTWGESLRHLFSRYSIFRLPGVGITVIDISWNNPDGPLGSQYPPGWKGELSDHREIDEDPWGDAK